MKDCGRCFYNDSMSRICGDQFCHQCKNCLHVERYNGELLAFCKLDDTLKNVKSGECFGNCKHQITINRKD